MKILILCTGNSCRSQMAEAFLKFFSPGDEIYSAGTIPSHSVHPKAIQVMKELNFDLSNHHPKAVEKFLDQEFDFLITVCGGAKESCPMFTGEVKQRLHIGFEDPAEATGSEQEILTVFRNIRDQIRDDFFKFYSEHLV